MHDLRIADQIGVVQAEFGLEDRVSDFIVGGARKDGGEAGAFGDGVAQACIGKEQDAELCDSNNGKEEQRRRQRELDNACAPLIAAERSPPRPCTRTVASSGKSPTPPPGPRPRRGGKT